MRDLVNDFHAAVAAALGAAPDAIEPGRMHRFSVNGKRGDTAGWCQLFADCRAGVYGDFRAGLSAVWTARDHNTMTRAERAELARRVVYAAAQRRHTRDAERAAQAPKVARLWEQCVVVQADGAGADPLTLYLRRRLALDTEPLPIPAALRLHPALPYHDDDGGRIGAWPAMVAALTSATGELATVHRTWLTHDGRKAPVPGPVKKLMQAAAPVMGGCIHLVDAAEWAGELLGIAEGIETALAARCASGIPTVAAYSAGSLAAWQWPPTLKRLAIFADADDTGQTAAHDLCMRARRADLAAEVLTPSTANTDWCDVWAGRGAVEKQT